MRRTRSEHIWSALGPNSRPFSGHRFAPLRAKTRLSSRSRRHNPDKWFRLQPCHLVVRGDAAPHAASPPISEMLRRPDFEFRAERSVLILPWRADQRKFVTTSLDGPNGDLPKFASNSRTNGTADENKAVVQGSISHFGQYIVSPADKSIVFHIELSTYPNFNGTEQKRSFELIGDELKYTVPAFSGGGTAVAIWKRAK
jgi:hypothetical protein